MTEDKTTITDNEEIARFMGYFNWEDATCGNYDKDWNRLMPVVEKIVKMKGVGMIRTSGAFHEMLIFHNFKKIAHTKGEEIMATEYQGVLEFIRWYNSTQNKEQS